MFYAKEIIKEVVCFTQTISARRRTSLHRYIATSLHRYIATSLHRYIATSLHRYIATSNLAFTRSRVKDFIHNLNALVKGASKPARSLSEVFEAPQNSPTCLPHRWGLSIKRLFELAASARSASACLLYKCLCVVVFMCVSSQTHAASETDTYICPNGKTLMASEVRTPEDVRAFARCARDFIAAKKNYSLGDFRTAFDQPQWLDPNGQGSYVFVNQDKNDGRQAIAQIHPYSSSAEGQPIGRIFTSFGDYIRNAHWIINRWKFTSGEGYVYYEWDNPATGSKKAPKFSYELRHHNRTAYKKDGFPGQPASSNYLVGSGVYVPELDGPCKASDLNTNPSPEKLQDFVRCAALKYQNYKGAVSASDIINSKFFITQQDAVTELRSGEVYVFVVDADTARIDWSAEHLRASEEGTQVDAAPEWTGRSWRSSSMAGASGITEAEDAGSATGAESQAVRIGIPNRKIAPVLRDFGEGFLYYKHQNPVAQQIENKVTYAKLIRDPNGKQVIIASGYYLSQGETLYPAYNCNQPTRRVQANNVETYDDLRAFVMQARCYVQTNGINNARREFKKPEWFSNNMYVFVSENKSTGPESILKIYPREPSREDIGFDDFNDRHGNAYYPEVHRIANLMGQGWMYYNFSAPEQNDELPKATYIASFEEGGRTYRIGAGLYPFVPGRCSNITANYLKQLQTEAEAKLDKGGRTRLSDLLAGRSGLRYVNGKLVNRVTLASDNVRDRATEYLQAFVRCAAQKFEQSDTIESAKVALVTGSNPSAEEDDLEARGLTGKWRSTFKYRKAAEPTEGGCSDPSYKTPEACEASPEWDTSREGYCSDPRYEDRTACTTAHTWTPNARCSHSPRPHANNKDHCERPLGVWIPQGTCYRDMAVAIPWPPGYDRVPIAGSGVGFSGRHIYVKRDQSTCAHSRLLNDQLAPDTGHRCVTEQANWIALNVGHYTRERCEVRGVWLEGDCSDARYKTQPACTATRTWTPGHCSVAGPQTEADCLAASTGRRWVSGYPTYENITLDGEFREAPIYSFLYDHTGKLVWGRNAGQHKRVLSATRQKNKPSITTEFEWGLALLDARGRGTRTGPRSNQNALRALNTFGETFVYYKANDYRVALKADDLSAPALKSNNVQRNKRAFVKKVRLGGKVYYLGAGLYE